MRYINSLLLYLLTYYLLLDFRHALVTATLTDIIHLAIGEVLGVQWVQMTHEQNTTQICTVDFYRMECQRGLATRKLFVKRVICDKTKES